MLCRSYNFSAATCFGETWLSLTHIICPHAQKITALVPMPGNQSAKRVCIINNPKHKAEHSPQSNIYNSGHSAMSLDTSIFHATETVWT